MTQQGIEKREKALRVAMEGMLPEFVKSFRKARDPLFIHQDAFGADYDEYELQPRIRVCPRRFPLFSPFDVAPGLWSRCPHRRRY